MRDLIITLFGVNGRLIDTGNRLTRDIGLTTARWQVLGALGFAPGPQTVADIARRMGLARQSVQRIVDTLAEAKLVSFAANPRHRRAQLVTLTSRGLAALEAAEAEHRPLSCSMVKAIGRDRIATAHAVLRELEEILAREAQACTGRDTEEIER